MTSKSLSLCHMQSDVWSSLEPDKRCTFALGHSGDVHSFEVPYRGPMPAARLTYDERLDMRLAFIENVLRANNLHTSYCDLHHAQKMRRTGYGVILPPCTCWFVTV